MPAIWMAPPNSSSFFGKRGLARVRVRDNGDSAPALHVAQQVGGVRVLMEAGSGGIGIARGTKRYAGLPFATSALGGSSRIVQWGLGS